MDLLQIARQDFSAHLSSLIGTGPDIIGVVPKGKRFAYAVLEKGDAFTLDYDETILPPKKYLMPPRETLLTFKPLDVHSYQQVTEARPQVLVGVHPCDLAAIALLDKAFSEGQRDCNYLLRRERTTLVGINLTQPYEYRFNSAAMLVPAYAAADVMLTDLGEGTLAVEVLTERGKALLQGSKATAAPATLQKTIDARKSAVKDTLELPVKGAELPAFLADKEDSPVFEARAKKCFSCGSCVLVCPTCYCFDVREELDLSLQSGERVRVWDGCTLESFASVAGNHNFRKTAANRLRHRLFRKGKYLRERFGLSGCVGCGRCAHACTAKIASPAETLNEIAGKGV